MNAFDELLALPSLRQLFDLAWRIFGVNPALVSLDGRRHVIFDKTERAQPFCRALQAIPAGQALCAMCDQGRFLEARRCGQSLRYRCHAGLVEFIIPVIRAGETIALIQCGQVHDRAPSAKEWQQARTSLRNARIRNPIFKGLFRRNRVMSSDRQSDALDLLSLIASRLASADHHEQNAPTGLTQVALGRAMTYIESHLDEPLLVENIARAAALSTRTLMRLFRKEVGLSVIAFVQQRRVARARHLLQTTDHTCGEIAFECGFGSVQHFNRVFRQLEGMAPKEWSAAHSLGTTRGIAYSRTGARVKKLN